MDVLKSFFIIDKIKNENCFLKIGRGMKSMFTKANQQVAKILLAIRESLKKNGLDSRIKKIII